jgi:enolase-phosphatase E1
MIDFAGRGILLDVEGTTSAVAFVAEVLFPYARRELAGWLERHWDQPATARACDLLARDVGASSLAAWVGAGETPEDTRRRVLEQAYRLMDHDAKATGLKELQGLIWQQGYARGELLSHVYPDVPPALKRWAERGLDVRIFSSGSVVAQRVFFAHTEAGDLLGLFRGHYDTTLGPKRDPDSYRRIAADMALNPSEILFLSDVPAELDAAAAAEMRTGLAVRPGNVATPAGLPHPVVTDFGEIRLPA